MTWFLQRRHRVGRAIPYHTYRQNPDFVMNCGDNVADDHYVAYVVKMVTDRHSLSVFDIDGRRLTMTQIDEAVQELDRIVITKAPRQRS